MYNKGMKVYRCVSESELKNILHHPGNLGGFFGKENHANTFHYKHGKKYIHFFKHKSDIALIKPYLKNDERLYVCTFDIPFRKLFFHAGKGIYFEKSGYEKTTAREFALPKDKYRQEFLTQIEQENDM